MKIPKNLIKMIHMGNFINNVPCFSQKRTKSMNPSAIISNNKYNRSTNNITSIVSRQANENTTKMTPMFGNTKNNKNDSNWNKCNEIKEEKREKKEKKERREKKGKKEKMREEEKIEKKEKKDAGSNYEFKNMNKVENNTQQTVEYAAYADIESNKNYLSPYQNKGYAYSSSIEDQTNNTTSIYDNNHNYSYKNNYSYNNNYDKYYNPNQYNQSYNRNEYNNNTSGGDSLSHYYRNDKYDYSLETNTENYQLHKIYCGTKGLSNNGNNCFLNSTIQCLKHCLIFTKYIINENVSSYGAFGAYKTLIENMCNNNSSNLNVLNLKKAMAKYNNIYSDHEQHDSTIFFNDLLNALNSELCEETSFDGDDYDDISNDDEFQIKFAQHITKSKVNEYFSFFIKEMTVFECGEKMVDYQDYYYLDLPIFDENNMKLSSLEEALAAYTKKSYDYGKNAFICNKHQIKERSYNQNLFVSLPEILVISLKRVVNGKHINHYIDYNERFDMGKYVHNILGQSTQYELFAEVLHYGGAFGGHKVAICKNFNTKRWYLFNDSSVTVESNIISSNAFLLFYKRI